LAESTRINLTKKLEQLKSLSWKREWDET
jgi:hypothetical protein